MLQYSTGLIGVLRSPERAVSNPVSTTSDYICWVGIGAKPYAKGNVPGVHGYTTTKCHTRINFSPIPRLGFPDVHNTTRIRIVWASYPCLRSSCQGILPWTTAISGMTKS
jgi:hypothetical protein